MFIWQSGMTEDIGVTKQEFLSLPSNPSTIAMLTPENDGPRCHICDRFTDEGISHWGSCVYPDLRRRMCNGDVQLPNYYRPDRSNCDPLKKWTYSQFFNFLFSLPSPTQKEGDYGVS